MRRIILFLSFLSLALLFLQTSNLHADDVKKLSKKCNNQPLSCPRKRASRRALDSHFRGNDKKYGFFDDLVNMFKTRYTDIAYVSDKTLTDFLWRIGGKKFDFNDDPALAKSCVDRIIDRVMDVLDMHPGNFHIKIFVHSRYEDGLIAFYSHKKGSITVYADRITDGVFAHEIAHAVICSFFSKPPPDKIQEILAQYVDKHLWSDYF